MFESIRKLLGRRQTLTEKEARALVSEVNRQVFEDSSVGFESRLDFVQEDLAPRIRAIEWFAGCGRPLSPDVSMPCRFLSDWPEAVAACSSNSWQDAQLEAQNQLTVWLCRHAPEAYQSWNDHAQRFKQQVITPVVDARVACICKEKDLPEEEKPEEADRDGAMGVLLKEEGRDGLRYEPP